MDTKREHRTHAEGSPRGKPCDLSHSPSGRLIGKFRDNNSVTLSATVDIAYGYCDDYQPHAVRRMFNYKNGMLYDMRWDKAVNLGQVNMAKLGDMFEAGRFLFWTEDSRMHAAVDDRYYSYYAYDHSGGSCASREQSQACLSYAEMEQRRRSQRRLKLTGDNKLLDVNADFMATYTILNEPTLYPSAYMVLTEKGYANVTEVESRASSLALPRCNVTERKHYYAGTERVAARLGGGGLDALYHVIGNDEELQVKADMLFKQSLEQVNHRVLHENDLDCIMQNEFSKEEFGYWIDDIPHQMKAEVEIDHGQFKDMVNSMLDDINHGQEKEVYFYHSDHLGSASWITDNGGLAVQHLQYLPYGERYVDQRASGYHERFTFTGKERDEETGYGYFGARYMDHELMTMWLSVDPMADKYPSISPYAYCAWNPVKLLDPDGNDWYQKGNDYYWSDKVVSKKTTPEGCKYIGNDNSLYKHFGLPSTSERKESSQVMHTLVGTNAESNNPYEPKYAASGLVSAKAKSSIDYSIQKDEKTGKLMGLTIKANLETAVSDYRAGGYAAAFLEVSCGSDRKSVAFKDNDGYAFVPRDMCSRRYMNASVSFSANKLSENCFSKIQIMGPWFSNGRPMTHMLSLGIVPGRLKHQYK